MRALLEQIRDVAAEQIAALTGVMFGQV